MGILGIDHVQLAAPPGCETEARRFFGDVLGLPEVPKPLSLRSRGGVWFQVGSQQLHVGVQAPFAPSVKAHPALAVAAGELEAVAERLHASGAAVRWHEEVRGVRRFFTEDPWGNRIELTAAPPAKGP